LHTFRFDTVFPALKIELRIKCPKSFWSASVQEYQHFYSDKLFLNVPSADARIKKWFDLARRKDFTTGVIYFCVDVRIRFIFIATNYYDRSHFLIPIET